MTHVKAVRYITGCQSISKQYWSSSVMVKIKWHVPSLCCSPLAHLFDWLYVRFRDLWPWIPISPETCSLCFRWQCTAVERATTVLLECLLLRLSCITSRFHRSIVLCKINTSILLLVKYYDNTHQGEGHVYTNIHIYLDFFLLCSLNYCWRHESVKGICVNFDKWQLNEPI